MKLNPSMLHNVITLEKNAMMTLLVERLNRLNKDGWSFANVTDAVSELASKLVGTAALVTLGGTCGALVTMIWMMKKFFSVKKTGGLEVWQGRISRSPSPTRLATNAWRPPGFTMYYRLLRGKHRLFVGFEDTDGKWKQVNPNLDFKEMKVFKNQPKNKDGGEEPIINNDTRYEQFVAAKKRLDKNLPG